MDEALGVIWDGTGLGVDGTIWGGEFLSGGYETCERLAHVETFRLPGGEAAVREPARSALALLYACYGAEAVDWVDLPPVAHFGAKERRLIGQMLKRGVNSPITSSMGRLFDGVAALAGLPQVVDYEGEAAIALEHAAHDAISEPYPFPLQFREDGAGVLDWRPLVRGVVADVRLGRDPGWVSRRFHAALVTAICDVVRWIRPVQVAFSGGCFQNRLLTEKAAAAVEQLGVPVLLHRQTPPNDGCISLGQAMIAAARYRSTKGP